MLASTDFMNSTILCQARFLIKKQSHELFPVLYKNYDKLLKLTSYIPAISPFSIFIGKWYLFISYFIRLINADSF